MEKANFKNIAAALILVGTVLSGCSQGEFRAEQLPSKQEIQAQIDRVEASKDIPAAAKPRILEGLKKSMERAK